MKTLCGGYVVLVVFQMDIMIQSVEVFRIGLVHIVLIADGLCQERWLKKVKVNVKNIRFRQTGNIIEPDDIVFWDMLYKIAWGKIKRGEMTFAELDELTERKF